MNGMPAKQGDSQTRSLLFSDYNDWYRLRSLLLRLSEWKMGGTAPYISAGDLQVAGEYAKRLNDVDCTYTLVEVKAMGWLPPGEALAQRETVDTYRTLAVRLDDALRRIEERTWDGSAVDAFARNARVDATRKS